MPAREAPAPPHLRSFFKCHREQFVDAAAALSLANLCFTNIWIDLVAPSAADYFRKAPVSHSYLAVTMANIGLVATFLFAVIASARVLRGRAKILAEVGFLAILTVPPNILRTRFPSFGFLRWLNRGTAPLFVLGALALAWAVIRWRRPMIRVARHLLVIMLPLLPVTFAEVVIHRSLLAPDAREFSRSLNLARIRPNQPRSLRAVWVIFDEFDQCMAFSRRSPDIQLPQLDRLRSESVYALRAHSPAANTIESIPSLTTGRIVEESSVANIADLKILYRGAHEYRLWTGEPNLFDSAHALGFNTGVAGWFLPYCRAFATTSCYWEPVASVFLREDYERYMAFPQTMWIQLAQQTTRVPGLHAVHSAVGRAPWTRIPAARRASREHSILEYRRIHKAAMERLLDCDLDLVFLHWPVPHGLFYFDRRTGNFSTTDGPNYFDALALVDRTVGDIRTTLERAGMWDDTALLISSDHPLRTGVMRDEGYWSPEEQRALGGGSCAYVPFMLKMPGQRQAVLFDRDFNTVVTADLLLSILQGKASTALEAVSWLEQHYNDSEEPGLPGEHAGQDSGAPGVH